MQELQNAGVRNGADQGLLQPSHQQISDSRHLLPGWNFGNANS